MFVMFVMFEYVPHVSTPKHRTCRHSGPITLSCLARSHSLAQHHKCRALSLSPSVWNPPIPTHPPTHKIPTTRFLLGSRQGAFDLLRPHLIERTQIQNHFYIHLRDFRVSGFGFRVKASGCRGWGLGLRSFPIQQHIRVCQLWYRVPGFGLVIHVKLVVSSMSD